MSTQSVSFSELETAAKPAPTAEAPVTPVVTEPKIEAPAQPQFTEQDVATLRTFADAGITIENYQQLLQANQLIQKLPEIIKTNPRVLTAEIAKADPQAYDNLLEAISDEWYEVKGRKLEKQQTANGGASSTVTSVDPRMESQLASLQSQLQSLIQERNQEKSQRQQEAVFSGYKSTVNGLLEKLPEGVPETSKDYIRLKTQELIYNDPQARERVAKGIYVDLPKYFAQASAKATADTKASADKEHARRAEVESRGGKEITPAAEAVNGTASDGPQEDPIWGSAALARDTASALKAAR